MNKFLPIVAMVLLLPPFIGHTATYSICESGCDYTTIQGAFDGRDLAPDDVVEIQDSRTYTENITWGSNDGGSSGHVVTLRAATGQTPTIDGRILSAVNYTRVGQIGQGVITVTKSGTSAIDYAIGVQADYVTVENMHVHDIYSPNYGGIWVAGNYNTVQNNTVHDIGEVYEATGSWGEGIVLDHAAGVESEHNIIQNNIVYNSRHSNISIYGDVGMRMSYNQILNNYVNSGYGECISILGTTYNLVDGNRCYNIGTVQTGFPKPAIQMSGSSNCSVRRNIIYNGHHYYAFEMSVYGNNYKVDNNYVYNNTIHSWGTTDVNNGGAAVALGGYGTGTTVSGNKFYNNIFWDIDASGNSGWYDGSYKLIFYATYGSMPAGTDWGNSQAALESSGLGGHDIKNNILRSNGGADYAYILGYANTGGTYNANFSTAQLDTNFTSCDANIESDPLFAASPAGNISASDTWWQLQAGSPAIDTGIAVTDANASIGGWAQLTYNGSAPDIGAYETTSDSTAPSVTITSTDSTIYTNTLSTTGTATDAVGVTSCKWSLSGAVSASVGTLCTGTTSWSCATSGYSSGANDLYLGCGDAAGNWSTSAHIHVTYTQGNKSIALGGGSQSITIGGGSQTITW